jgi:CRP-like cAMP-binding protein
MEKLIAYFAQSGFRATEIAQIMSAFSQKSIPKGEFFVREGQTSRHLAFVDKGFLQYFILLDGEEKTTYTAGEKSFVASLVSFLQAVPAKENIRAVVDTELWVLERKRLQELLLELPAFQTFYVGLLEWQICCIDESRLDGLMLSARERYEKMLVKEPGLIREIPLQYLASILGVTPRHLSRIRGEIR